MNSRNWWDFPTSCFSCRGRKMRGPGSRICHSDYSRAPAQCYLCLLDAELTGMVRLWQGENASATPRSLSHSLANCMISENGLVSRLTALETGLLCLSHKQVSPVNCRWRQNMVFKPNS
uniref:Uncharacterized protein n=1 Tax=Rhinopithecus roxellana TaxID=61622 RepID=A0A2K6NWD8_RHIRO